MKRVLPDCAFNRVTSFSAFSLTSLVLLQTAFFSVLEKTTLGILFMKSAMSPFWEGQYEAMPSYVTRPNKSMSADRSCSRESCSRSSPQTDSCQSMSQLLGPSKKPSRVIRFHMTSCLTFGSPQSGRPKCRSFKYLSMMLLLQDPRRYCWAADLFLHFWEEAGEHLLPAVAVRSQANLYGRLCGRIALPCQNEGGGVSHRLVLTLTTHSGA